MKTSETKTASPSQQTTAKSEQNFFQKEGESAFFSEKPHNTDFFFSPPTVQPKLKIGQPGDRYEQEADAMAEQVSRKLAQPDSMPEIAPPASAKGTGAVSAVQTSKIEENREGPEVQRKPIFESEAEPVVQTKPAIPSEPAGVQPAAEEEERNENGLDTEPEPAAGAAPPPEEETAENNIQARSETEASASPPDLADRLARTKGYGAPLPEPTRHSMESAFGADFSGVRVHTSTEAGSMNEELRAQAFTHGSDIYFNEGKYDTESTAGKELLAHELTHTVQQGAVGQADVHPKSEMENENTNPSEDDLPENSSSVERQTSPEDGTLHSENRIGTSQGTVPARGNIDNELASAQSQPGEKVEKKDGGPAIILPSGETPKNEGIESTPVQNNVRQNEKPPPEPGKQLNLGVVKEQQDATLKQALPGKNGNEPIGKDTKEPGSRKRENAQQNVQGKANEQKAALGDIESIPGVAKRNAILNGQAEALIPPANPENLRAQTPERDLTRDEILAEYYLGRDQERSRAETNNLFDQFKTEVEQEKSAITTFSEIQKAEISAFSEAQLVAIRGYQASGIAQIESLFSQARSGVLAYAEQQKLVVETQFRQDIAKVEAQTTAKLVEIQQNLDARKAEMEAFAAAEAQQPRAIADQESARAANELESAAQQAIAEGEQVAAQYPGNEDPAPDQRSAARQVANESAADIRDKIPAIDDDLHEKATDYDQRYNGFAEQVCIRIDEAQPQLEETINNLAENTKISLQVGKSSIIQSIEYRLQADLNALQAAETEAIERLQANCSMAIEDTETIRSENEKEIESAKILAHTEIDGIVQETEVVVTESESPYVPGVVAIIDASKEAVQQTSLQAQQIISEGVNTTKGILEESTQSFNDQCNTLVSNAQTGSNGIQDRSRDAISSSVDQHRTNAQNSIDQLIQDQQETQEQGLVAVDQAIENARQEMRSVTEEFRNKAGEVTNESIEEAKKPLTDPNKERAQEAANEVDEGFWGGVLGFLEGLGELIAGLVFLVAIAAVIALLTPLSLGAALLFVGAFALGFAIGYSYQMRKQQLAALGIEAGPIALTLLALSDATGITQISESMYGRDIVTGETLSTRERWRRGTVGWGTALMLYAGARGVVKGAPPRITSPRGWRSLKGEFAEMGKGIWEDIKRFFERGEEKPSTEQPSQRRSGRQTGEAGTAWEDQVRSMTGGQEEIIQGRQIDSVTPEELIQAKDVNPSSAKNFLSKSTRAQIKETIRIAGELGKRAVFWFRNEPLPEIRSYIEERGGIVRTGTSYITPFTGSRDQDEESE